MKLPAIVCQTAMLCLLLASQSASATVVTLPTSPSNERPLLNVRTGDTLDAQSACTAEAGCQPGLPGMPVAASPSQIAAQGIAPAASNSLGLFAAAGTSSPDKPLPSPPASQSMNAPDVPAYVLDAADKFASEEDLKWKVKLKLLQGYAGMRALASMIDLGQDNALDPASMVAGQHNELATAGVQTDYTSGRIVSDLSSVCVARDGSYNTVGASTQRDCPAGSIYVGAGRSTSMAEYAAYAQSLGSTMKSTSPSSSSLHAVDWRSPRNEPTPRQYKHGSDNDDQGNADEPGVLRKIMGWIKDPLTLGLLALAVIAALVVDTVARSRRG